MKNLIQPLNDQVYECSIFTVRATKWCNFVFYVIVILKIFSIIIKRIIIQRKFSRKCYKNGSKNNNTAKIQHKRSKNIVFIHIVMVNFSPKIFWPRNFLRFIFLIMNCFFIVFYSILTVLVNCKSWNEWTNASLKDKIKDRNHNIVIKNR